MEFGGDDCTRGGEKFVTDGYRRSFGSLREISVCESDMHGGMEPRNLIILFSELM